MGGEHIRVGAESHEQAAAGLSRYEREMHQVLGALGRAQADAERAASTDVQTCRVRVDAARRALDARQSQEGHDASGERRSLHLAEEGLGQARSRLEIVLRANREMDTAKSRYTSGQRAAVDSGRRILSLGAERIGEYLGTTGALGRAAMWGVGTTPTPASADISSALGRLAVGSVIESPGSGAETP